MEIVSMVCIIVGGLAFLSSIVFRTADTPPIASLNPKHWKPIWHTEVEENLQPPGYVLMTGGLILFLVGILLRWVFVDWPW